MWSERNIDQNQQDRNILSNHDKWTYHKNILFLILLYLYYHIFIFIFQPSISIDWIQFISVLK